MRAAAEVPQRSDIREGWPFAPTGTPDRSQRYFETVLRSIWAIVLLVLVIAACSGGNGSTELNVVLRNAGGEENTYRLRCNPAGGTVPNPSAACRALADHAETMLAQPNGGLCVGGHGTMFVDVRGLYRGKTIATELRACGGNGQGLVLWLRHLPFPPTGHASNAGSRVCARASRHVCARNLLHSRSTEPRATSPRDVSWGSTATKLCSRFAAAGSSTARRPTKAACAATSALR